MLAEFLGLLICFKIIDKFHDDYNLYDAPHSRVVIGFSICCMMVIAIGLTASIFEQIVLPS
jgi:hypothetical protein